MTTGKSLDIAIIGGSLGGLFSAIPLLRAPEKHRVTIFERNRTPLLHDQGAGIVAAKNVQKWLDKFDAWGMVSTVPSTGRQYFNRDGAVISSEVLAQKMTSWDLIYHIGRANFDGLPSEHVSRIWDETMSGPKAGLLKDGWSRAHYEYGRSVEELRLIENGSETKVEVRWKDTKEGSETKGQEKITLVDYVVCADGASSTMRKQMLEQGVEYRKYVGYCAFRGTIPELELDQATLNTFLDRFSFYHSNGTQILAYAIPGVNGATEPGKRFINWVWYWNFPENGEEFAEVMTDSEGKKHRYTIPTGGKIHPNVWEKQKQRAKDFLPPQFATLVTKTEKPFIQAVTDVKPPKQGTKVGRLLDGRVTFVGDSLAGFRPHTAASTNQAAYDALRLDEAMSGKRSWDSYEEDVLQFASDWQSRGVMLGMASQFSGNPQDDTAGTDGLMREERVLRMMARDVEFGVNSWNEVI